MMPNQAYRVGIWWLLQLVMNFHWFDRNQSGAPLTVRFLRERDRVREREGGSHARVRRSHNLASSHAG
jgi:hypothetical protein